MKQKHIPLRMCVGCRQMFEKPNLIKIVVSDEKLVIDINNKIQSRSIYVCKKKECIENANKKKAFSKMLGSQVSEEFMGELMKYAE